MSLELERRAELRADRAAQAAASARSRTPVGIVVLGLALFFASLGVLLLAARARSSAQEALSVEQETLTQVSKRADRIAELKTKAASKTDDRVFLSRDVLADIKRAALPELQPAIESSGGNRSSQSNELRKISYAGVQHVNPELLLEWVENATTRIPGLYVEHIRLTPMQQFWKLDVDFIGWEKK